VATSEELEVVDGVVVVADDDVGVVEAAVVVAGDVDVAPVVFADDDTVAAPVPAADVDWVVAEVAADRVDDVDGIVDVVDATGTAVGSSVNTNGLPAGVDGET